MAPARICHHGPETEKGVGVTLFGAWLPRGINNSPVNYRERKKGDDNCKASPCIEVLSRTCKGEGNGTKQLILGRQYKVSCALPEQTELRMLNLHKLCSWKK